jgi:diguanylate cyclase (GGDEF)-like protein
MKENKHFDIVTYSLASSTEVAQIVNSIYIQKKRKVLIHISAFIHNTVLVQTLKKELLKKIPDAILVEMKHDDKSSTSLTLFTTDKMIEDETFYNEIINELHLENQHQKNSINEYRNQLFNRYFTDNLTNLPNLYQLRKDLQSNEDYGLILLKLDNFLTINNFYGFVVGDYVIEDIARYLKENFKEHQIYRLSGAEFALVLNESLGFYELKEYLNKLYLQLKHLFVLYQETRIFVDFTLSSSASSIKNSSVFSKVSMALKYAQDNKVPFWIYEDRMNFENEYKRNLQLSELVREGIENEKVIPFFQAIIDNQTGKIVKYESLARLIDTHGNILSPVLFIPVAKKIKVYNEITRTIIAQSFKTFENTQYRFNINLSIEDIMNSEMFNFIITTLKNSNAAKRVTFELLESEAIQDFNKVERFINEVKRYGASIAIDDFGSGYSNFSYLIRMRVDYIKIDGSLIENIDVDKQSHLVVETIVEFAKKLGVQTIAEYVHSSAVMDVVKKLGIDFSQGFYIDEPSISKEDIKS